MEPLRKGPLIILYICAIGYIMRESLVEKKRIPP